MAKQKVYWRNSPRLSPIGEKLVDIRQLAKSTIGEKEDWRWDISPKNIIKFARRNLKK